MMRYQDLITKMGLGSAHPGGYSATKELLQEIQFPRNSSILEVGCGTGRTACLLAKMGHKVTGVDLSKAMIEKAKRRAAQEKVSITWIQADVCNLPFADRSFDIIFAESVSVFVNINEALREYYRVLKENGFLYDREMMALDHLSPSLKQELQNFYGAKIVPSPTEWKSLVHNAAFTDVTIWKETIVADEMRKTPVEDPDLSQIMDGDLYSDPSFIQISIMNSELMFKTANALAHGVIIAKK